MSTSSQSTSCTSCTSCTNESTSVRSDSTCLSGSLPQQHQQPAREGPEVVAVKVLLREPQFRSDDDGNVTAKGHPSRFPYSRLKLTPFGGTFAIIYFGDFGGGAGNMALKRLRLVKLKKSQNDLTAMRVTDIVSRDCSVFKSICHENAIYFSDTLTKDKPLHLSRIHDVALAPNEDGDMEPLLVFERANAKPTLAHWLDGHRHFADKDIPQRLSFAIQLFSGLEELHPGYIHNDIKPNNILLFNSDPHRHRTRLALTDFGLSKPISDKSSSYGTWPFSAPEVWLRMDTENPALRDVWAAGLVVVSLFQSAGPRTERAFHAYRALCRALEKSDAYDKKTLRENLLKGARAMVHAMLEDANNGSHLLLRRIAGFLHHCFQETDRRPNSTNCKNALISIWDSIYNKNPWESYRGTLQRPLRSSCIKLSKYYRAAADHCFRGHIAKLMFARYERALRAVQKCPKNMEGFAEVSGALERMMQKMHERMQHAEKKEKDAKDADFQAQFANSLRPRYDSSPSLTAPQEPSIPIKPAPEPKAPTALAASAVGPVDASAAASAVGPVDASAAAATANGTASAHGSNPLTATSTNTDASSNSMDSDIDIDTHRDSNGVVIVPPLTGDTDLDTSSNSRYKNDLFRELNHHGSLSLADPLLETKKPDNSPLAQNNQRERGCQLAVLIVVTTIAVFCAVFAVLFTPPLIPTVFTTTAPVDSTTPPYLNFTTTKTTSTTSTSTSTSVSTSTSSSTPKTTTTTSTSTQLHSTSVSTSVSTSIPTACASWCLGPDGAPCCDDNNQCALDNNKQCCRTQNNAVDPNIWPAGISGLDINGNCCLGSVSASSTNVLVSAVDRNGMCCMDKQNVSGVAKDKTCCIGSSGFSGVVAVEGFSSTNGQCCKDSANASAVARTTDPQSCNAAGSCCAFPLLSDGICCATGGDDNKINTAINGKCCFLPQGQTADCNRDDFCGKDQCCSDTTHKPIFRL